jgi:hypothetical protein
MYTNSLGRIISIHIKQRRGQDGTLWNPSFHYSWRRHFAFHRNTKFSVRKKKANELEKLAEKSNIYNLCSKPLCHVVSNAFSISKNTTAIDMLLWKLRVT